jgi:hypothetical protein
MKDKQQRPLVDQHQGDDWYKPQIMRRFLDFLVNDALSNKSKLVPYTQEMSARARKLITGVRIDN